VPDPEIFALTSTKGWPKIAYDKTIWIPCPPEFNGELSREEWAQGFASLWWEASGFKHGKRPVKAMENDLTGVLNYAWRVEELETDLRVFTACGDLGRLAAAAPAIDELIHQISVEPR
jgi:hypothetical protein